MPATGYLNRLSGEFSSRRRRVGGRAPARFGLFCARRGHMGANHGRVEHLHQVCSLARTCECLEKSEKSVEGAGLVQSTKPLPDAVPGPKRSGRVRQVMLWTTK